MSSLEWSLGKDHNVLCLLYNVAYKSSYALIAYNAREDGKNVAIIKVSRSLAPFLFYLKCNSSYINTIYCTIDSIHVCLYTPNDATRGNKESTKSIISHPNFLNIHRRDIGNDQNVF